MRRGNSSTLGRPVSEADDLPEPTPPPIARLRGKLQVTWATVRRYPSVVIVPLVIFSLIVGLGVFGVVAGMQRVVVVRQNDAWELASTTLTAFALTVQQSTTTVAAIGVYIQRNPIWPVFKAGFGNMTQSLLAASFQNEKIVQVEVSANGVLDAIYPNWVGGEGLDILNCCLADAMREVTAKVLKVDGPYLLQQGQLALIASMPVFVPSNVSSPATDPAWQLPTSAGNCSAPACYDPVTKLKWYGTVYSIMFLSELVADPATKLPGLISAGWWFSLRRTDTVHGQTNLQSVLASYGGEMSHPISASTVIGGTTYELLLAPSDGWQQNWWPAVIVAVVVIGFVISILVFFTMMSKQQKSWLLYSILPRQVVQTLRRGSQWSQKSDCCVLFADVVGFTRITSTMAPEDIATMVGQLFCMYETMTSQHGLTKVDIIGDCFLAAAGMMTPETPEVCAVKAARLALDMVSACDGLVTRDGTPVQVRIGLHAGPVVSVVVGVQSPKLTVFGDVVNTCSRLQSTSLPACVQVSGIVAERLVAAGPEAKGMVLVPRGEVELKNRGVLSTWWVQRGTGSGESSPTFSLGDPALQGGAMESNPQAGPFAYPNSYPALIGAETAGEPDWCDHVAEADLPDGLATTITIRPEGLRSAPLPQMLLALGDANGSNVAGDNLQNPEPFDPVDADWRVPTGAPTSASISIPGRAVPSDSQPSAGLVAGAMVGAVVGEMVGELVGSGRPQGSGGSSASGSGGLSGRVAGHSPPPSVLMPGSLPLDDVNLLPDIPESPFAHQRGTERGQAHRSPTGQASAGGGLPVALDGGASSSRDASPSIPLWDLVALSAASAGITPSGDRRSNPTPASQKSGTRPRASVSLVALANESTVSQVPTPGGSASRPQGSSSTSTLPPRLGGLVAELENSNRGPGTGSGGDSCRSSEASTPQAASPLWTTDRLGSETTAPGLQQGMDALRTRLGQPGLQGRGFSVPATVHPAAGPQNGASASSAAAAGPGHRPPTRTQSTRTVQVQASGGSACATGTALGQSRSGSCNAVGDPEGAPRSSAPIPSLPSTILGHHKVVLGQPLQASPTSLSYFPPEFHSLTAMTDRRSATGGRQRRTSQTSQLQLTQGSSGNSLRGSASVVNPAGTTSFPDDALSPANQIASRAQTSGGQPRSLGFVDQGYTYQGQSTFSTTSYHHSSSTQQHGPSSSVLLNSSGFADLDATRMSRNSGLLGESRDGDVEEGTRLTGGKKPKKQWSFRRLTGGTPAGGKPAKAADPYWGQNLSTGMLQYTKQAAHTSAGGAEEASGPEAAAPKRSFDNNRNLPHS